MPQLTKKENVIGSVGEEETQPLVAERRGRRTRRARRPRRHDASINSDARAHIGVAALPVSPAETEPPHVVL
ncbi:unnamed protein product [Parnassius mnemosyne]|uniref:Uncharacterized protein n=1 Tax=Parnassius mnemosyne TaxID=213953 RepID=A0AAV1LZ14_9NEOP